MLALLLCTLLQASTFAITNVTVFPITSNPLKSATVIVQNGKIISIGTDQRLANDIERINITSPGAGYLGPCTVLVQDPAALSGNAGIGTFWFNEVVIGASSSVSARVKNWDQEEGVLQVGQENGTFFAGENIIGQSSGAIYVLDKYMLLSEVPAAGSVQNIDDYDQNDLFEGEADMILDFTEVNPFGEV